MVLLRWGLAFTFFYAAVNSLLAPQNWIGYLPAFLIGHSYTYLLLTGFSVYEIILAAWLFSGRELAWTSLAAALTLIIITLANLAILETTFRDVGLALAALALWELAKDQKKESAPLV